MTMPDLPPEQKAEEQRKALKWWIEHSQQQEQEIDALRLHVKELTEKLKTIYFL